MARRITIDEDDPPPRPKRSVKGGGAKEKDVYGFRLQLKGQQKQERSECSTSAQAMLPDWAFVPQVQLHGRP